ncbi:synaptic vesicle glycoprotein 2Ca [Nematolebias whitei]|uniref:synaptic vesicle glycoprotein 2Ca n=1 Tax=Nematolebias whitei TaxID=451745 RepID=UPI001899707B|nr:synaptic vesicle glycoprotein 2Ca [Nematolebias whitei]
MEDTYNNRTSLVKGAKDMVKEAKRHAAKKVNKVVDRATDEYSSHRNYARFQDEEDDREDFYRNQQGQEGENYQDNEEGSSDATEGHDDEDEIYEGEYQGIPSAGDKKREGKVALGQPVSDATRGRDDLEQERQADEEELAQQYELIMQECGHGRFQWQLFLVLGMALMSDGVEVFVVGFVLPSAETDMCVPNSSSGWLGSIVYLGMMVGAFFWGGMSDKVGRRQCLLICMSTNGFFAFLSSFVQGYGLFLLCRLAAGFGIGGAVPIVFSFFAEVLSREKRGEHLSWLCMFWMIGEIYASAMAWAIIPHYGEFTFSLGALFKAFSYLFILWWLIGSVAVSLGQRMMREEEEVFQTGDGAGGVERSTEPQVLKYSRPHQAGSGTDIDDSKLIEGTEVINSTFTHNKTGCQMTFDDDYSAYWVYFINFLGTLAVLPGNIVSALLMDKIGRLSMLGGSMILSGISCFFLWFGTSESMMIFMLCLYNGLSISAWNSLDVVTTESFPTDRRGTGFGFCNALCKLAAVMGNLIFGSLVGITKAVPILMASSMLVGGGLVGLRLPDTRTNVLM